MKKNEMEFIRKKLYEMKQGLNDIEVRIKKRDYDIKSTAAFFSIEIDVLLAYLADHIDESE